MTSEPVIGKPMHVEPPDSLMVVPAFIAEHGSDEDKFLALEMLRITRETRVLLGQFFLYTALTRSKEFADVCNASDAKDGLAIVVGSIMRTMVVSAAALFDGDQRTSNIPKTLRMALSPARSEFLRIFHQQNHNECEWKKSRERLIRFGRAIKAGRWKAAIKRLVAVRNTFVAHFEFQPTELGKGERAINRDFDRVILVASLIVREANVFALGRKVDEKGLRTILQSQADGLTSTLLRGFKT